MGVAVDWRETEGTVASVARYESKGVPIYEVVFTYKVEGSWYGGTFTTLAPHFKGDALAVRYDPSNPEKNNFLKREGIMRWVYIVFFTLLGIMAVYLFMQPKVK